MDSEDPIQQLLKNTGWSCDELLQRIQKLKSSSTSDNDQLISQCVLTSQRPERCLQIASSPKSHDTSKREDSNIDKVNSSAQQDAVPQTSEVENLTLLKGKSSQLDSVHSEISPSLKLVEKLENVDSNVKASASNVIPASNPYKQTNDCVSTTSSVISNENDKKEINTFSNVDDDELEANTIVANTITEKTGDLSNMNTRKPELNIGLPILDKLNCTSNVKTEVTEVEVIEVDEEEPTLEDTRRTLKPEEIEYLQNNDRYETVIATESPKTKINSNSGNNKQIEYVEIHSRKNFSIVERSKPPIDIKQNVSPVVQLKKNPVSSLKPKPNCRPAYVIKRRILPKLLPATNSPILTASFPLALISSSPGVTSSPLAISSPLATISSPTAIISSPTAIISSPVTTNSPSSNKIIQIKKIRNIRIPSPAQTQQNETPLDPSLQKTVKIVREFTFNKDNTKFKKTFRSDDVAKNIQEKAALDVNEKINYPSFSVMKKIPLPYDPITSDLQIKPETVIKSLEQKSCSLINQTYQFHKVTSENTNISTNVDDSHNSKFKVDSELPHLVSILKKPINRLQAESQMELLEMIQNSDKPGTSIPTKTVPEPDDRPLIKKMLFPISKENHVLVEEDSDDEVPSTENFSMDKLEDLRNSLKLQLDSLRNRKKNIFISTFSTKLIDNIERSKKLSLLESKKSRDQEESNVAERSIFYENRIQEEETTTIANKKQIESNQEKSLDDNNLYTQTNELGLVILNVQGGVELDEDELKTENEGTQKIDSKEKPNPSNLTETIETKGVLDEEEEDNRVFDQIRKIINKQKPYKAKNSSDSLHPVKGRVELDADELENEDTQKIDNKKEYITETIKEKTTTYEEKEDMGVFDQIRKIINKQKQSKSNNLNSSDSLEPMVSKCQYSKIDDKKNDLFSFSGDNSRSSFIESVGIEEKSPFVSETLDEFLTDSQLNISYQVPKLGAEESLKKLVEERINTLAEQLPPILKKPKQIKLTHDGTVNNTKLIKAKTVAQKRRILEKERRKELKRLEKQKLKENKDHNDVKLKEEFKIKEELDVKKKYKQSAEHYNDKSYVLFKDNKIWVNSYLNNTCLARINCTKVSVAPKSPQRKKWSLLSPERKIVKTVQYLPGPLSKKQNLQIFGREKWESDVLKLPIISLEVTPQLGKSFHNDVLQRLFSITGSALDTNRVDFALTMVQTKEKPKNEEQLESFEFPLKYHNHVENILIRLKKPLTVKPVKKPTELIISKDPIADVIEGLIRYVEIKELAPTLIKEDPTYETVQEKIDTLLSPVIENNVSVFKKPQRKRSKIEIELLRLSCKVVNVEVEDNQEEICNKPYCELGCVCKSLKCDYVHTQHCQKISCMFNCTCPEEKPLIYDKLTLPPGTNILSEDAVTRIEDEAKKNLAKVEREFTQTVIHTSDKTIVVGIGSRTKTRRCAKVPAKYTDYVPTTEALCEEDKFSSSCTVDLPKLNLSNIIPFCLRHTLYDCYCKGQGLWGEPRVLPDAIPASTSKLSRSSLNNTYRLPERPTLRPKIPRKYTFDTEEIDEENESTKSTKKLKKCKNHFQNEVDGERKEDWSPLVGATSKRNISKYAEQLSPSVKFLSHAKSVDNETSSNSSDNSSSKRPVRTIKKRCFSEDFIQDYDQNLVSQSVCRRTKCIPKKYLKSYQYSKDVFKNDFIFNISDADLLKLRIEQTKHQDEQSESELLKQALIQEKLSENLKQTQSRNKRKQSLMTRDDNCLKSSTHVEKKVFKEGAALQRRKKLSVHQLQKNMDLFPVFEGEIIIDEQNMELLQKMGPKTVADGYARLLPWEALIKSFLNNTINIWSMVDQPSRLLINKIDKKCPKNYVNIKETKPKTEVIRWILENRLPSSYQKNSLSFILKETKDNFEICGICTKNITDHVENNQINADEMTLKGDNVIFYHKDINGREYDLLLSKEQNLESMCMEAIIEDKPLDLEQNYMWVRLPSNFKSCRWRMILLNSDFTYLVFKKSQYSIRYTDLLVISEYSQKHECTVSLRNRGLQKGYDHLFYGIYFDGRLPGRIFIGPYYEAKGNDLETLRYINKTLVSTENFNKMRGNGDYKCGYWLLNSNNKNPMGTANGTVDLTEKEGTVESGKNLNLNAPYIMHKNKEIHIIDAPPRKPEDFNRYIITNIPYFGYLGAFRHPNGEIDVSWPFENKLLRFDNESYAKSFLQERLSALLQSVPESFKITIIVSLKIDLSVYKPINSSVLNGHYICGDFGYFNIMLLSEKQCMEKAGVSKDEIFKMFARRSQKFLEKKVEDIANILNVPQNTFGGYDLVTILRKAQKEIEFQRRKEKIHLDVRYNLHLKKRRLIMKLLNIFRNLPPSQRQTESIKFRSIVQNKEAIEIYDSDDDVPNDSGIKVQFFKNADTLNNSTQVFKTPSPLTHPSKTKMKSVLKPLVNLPVKNSKAIFVRGQSPSLIKTKSLLPDSTQYIRGVKIVKTNKGLIIVSDDQTNDQHNSPSTSNSTRVVISDNSLKKVVTNISSDKSPTSSAIRVSPISSPNKLPLRNLLSPSPSSNQISISRVPDTKLNNESLCNNDRTIIIDLDADDEGKGKNKVTELRIIGDKVIKTVRDLNTNAELKQSTEVSEMINNHSENPENICKKTEDESVVIDLESISEEDPLEFKNVSKRLSTSTENVDCDTYKKIKLTKPSLKEFIDLDELEDADNDGKPPSPEFICIPDHFDDKMDCTQDEDIDISLDSDINKDRKETIDQLESNDEQSDVSENVIESCSDTENNEDDVTYIS